MNIYLAGKIAHTDWRHDIVKHLRSAYSEVDRLPDTWGVLENAIFGLYHYTGPYFLSCDHGCAHGKNSHGVGVANGTCYDRGYSAYRTALLCREAIGYSDIVFAWIESPDAYGTIAELGYAKGIGVPVYIAGPKRFDDLWFVYEFCGSKKPDFKSASAKEALEKVLVDYLRRLPYDEYLKTPHWNKVRTVALERAHFRCQLCNKSGSLHVHHRTYERRGHELPEDVIALCGACHEIFHRNGKLYFVK